MDYKKFEDNLANYLTGKECDLYSLMRDLKQFHMCKYNGYIFRGMYFNHPVDKYDIADKDVCSWSIDLDVATNFASHGRYGIVIVKKSNGVSIQALLKYLYENNLVVSESLKRCTSKYENEVIDSMYSHEYTAMEVMK
jgi:hypothetical protein